MYLSTWSCQHICFLCFGCIYWHPEPPTEDLKENNHSSHFSVNNEECFNKNSHSFFFAKYAAWQTSQSGDRNCHTNRKKYKKSIASRVRSNSFIELLRTRIPHYRSLKTTPCSFSICFIWEKSLVALSRAFAILNIFLSPSGVSNSSYNSFIARALVVATAYAHTMKIRERIIDRRLREETTIGDEQFAVRQLMERRREKQKGMHKRRTIECLVKKSGDAWGRNECLRNM